LSSTSARRRTKPDAGVPEQRLETRRERRGPQEPGRGEHGRLRRAQVQADQLDGDVTLALVELLQVGEVRLSA